MNGELGGMKWWNEDGNWLGDIEWVVIVRL
jgi:hypothetical protein